MRILFPCDPIRRGRVETDFLAEWNASNIAGFSSFFYSHESLLDGDVDAALAAIPDAGLQSEAILLRGWMMPGETYARLYEALRTRGYQPVVNPAAYEETHYLPLGFRHIEPHTARVFG